MKNPFEELAAESPAPAAGAQPAASDNPFLSLARESEASRPAQAKLIEVEHPTLGKLSFDAGTSADEIAKDINKRELEVAKIDAATPQLTLRQQWEAAQSPGERLQMMADWVMSRRGAGIASRAVIAGAGTRLPLVGRPIAGAASEIVGSAIAGEDTDTGKIARAAIESLPRGGQRLLPNIAQFMGAGAAGEVAREAIQGEDISFKKVLQNASQSGLGAVVLAKADKGKFAAKETQRMLGQDQGIINTLTQANENGLIVDPTLYGATPARSLMSKAGGGASAFQKDASVANAPRVIEILKQDIGAAPDQSLVPMTFADLKSKASKPYEEVAKISTTAKDAVKEWKTANADAAKQYAKAVESNNPQARELARQYSDQAEKAFQTIESEALKAGNPGLVTDIKEARVRLAKIHAVEGATSVGNGYPDAKVIAAMFEDNPGKFTGGLEVVGRVASAMPQVLQDPRKISNRGVNLGFGAAGVGSMIAGSAAGSPLAGAALGLGAATVPPLMRQAAMSRAYQAATFLPKYGTETPDIPASILRFAAQQQNQPE